MLTRLLAVWDDVLCERLGNCRWLCTASHASNGDDGWHHLGGNGRIDLLWKDLQASDPDFEGAFVLVYFLRIIMCSLCVR